MRHKQSKNKRSRKHLRNFAKGGYNYKKQTNKTKKNYRLSNLYTK